MLTKVFQLLFRQTPQDFSRGKWVFTSPIPGELRLIICVAAIAAVYWLYRRTSFPNGRGAARWLLGLRVAVIALLLFILGAPVFRTQEANKASSFTAVLVDTSQSMSISDIRSHGSSISRLTAGRDAMLGAGSGLIPQLSDDGQVILYSFADQARRATANDLNEAAGSRTDLFKAIRDVDNELRNVPLSAVVLVTDGCRNTGGANIDAARLLQARGVPLFVLGVGDPKPPKDLEVVQVLAPAKAPVGSQVDLDITVRHTGFDQPFDLLLKRGDEVILTRRIQPVAGSDLQRVRFTFTPEQQGPATYHVEIPVADGETITQNNSKDVLIDCRDDRLPVLYVEGSPRMEYRFMRRALFSDPTFRLVGLLRLNTDRFYLQGASKDEAYLQKGFPTTPEQLAQFKAIILGDIEASYFTPAQLQMIEDFVKVRGGGLLMLGGVNSFGPGGYANTAVGRALPVVMSPSDARYTDQQFVGQAIASTLDHPVMRLSLDPVENKVLWDNAPPLIGVTPVQSVKPGATLLVRKPDTLNPVLAVQAYGQGRSAAFTSGGSWYWQVSRPSTDGFHERFWKQLVRWLAVGAEDQLSINTDASVYSRHDPVTITASVLGKDLRPLDDAKVTASVIDPAGNSQQLPMDWILSQEGVYVCRYVPDQIGQYQVHVQVDSWTSPPADASFAVSDSTVEFADAALKQDVLRDMAATTHGRYFDYSEASQMPGVVKAAVHAAAVGASEPQDKPIWDMPVLMVALIVLLGAEWLMRRRSGLS